MSRWQPGTRSMAAPAPPISTCPMTSSPANATSTKSFRSSAHPTRHAWWRNAAQIQPQIHDDEAPANYFRALRDVAAWMPKNSILSAEGAGTMDIGLTQLPSFSARSCLNAGTYGTMGVGLGHAIAACIVHPDRPEAGTGA